MTIVGKYAFKGFSDEGYLMCIPGCASELAYSISSDSDHEWDYQTWNHVAPLGSDIWRYGLSDVIRTTAKSSLAEGN